MRLQSFVPLAYLASAAFALPNQGTTLSSSSVRPKCGSKHSSTSTPASAYGQSTTTSSSSVASSTLSYPVSSSTASSQSYPASSLSTSTQSYSASSLVSSSATKSSTASTSSATKSSTESSTKSSTASSYTVSSKSSTASSTSSTASSTSSSKSSAVSSTSSTASSTSSSKSSTVSSTSSAASSTSSSKSSTVSSTSSIASSTTSSKSSTVSSTTSTKSSTSSSTTSSKSSTITSSTSTSSKSSSTTSSSTTSSASATASCDYWLEHIKSQGIASFNSDPSNYAVFRNVKDYGAKGDGVTDDTAAINLAISDANRCAPGSCASSTTTPALVYFPNGTYLVSDSIVDYYYTQIVGNPNCLPVIKASSKFTASWVIDGDKYNSWGPTNVFWRQIRNFIIDTTAVAPSVGVSGIHWPTAQATSLQNIAFKMSAASGTQHVGLHIEDGSGGFVNDLVFYGGLQGLSVGNQQFTMRNLTFHNSLTAISQVWDWGWTYTGISINNCGVGLDITSLTSSGDQNVGSVVFIDSEINNTPIGISTVRSTSSTPASGGSLILENVTIKNVTVAVQGASKSTLLAGSSGSSTIAAWGQGHQYTTAGGSKTVQGTITGNVRSSSLTSGTAYYARSKPQYEHLPLSQFVSIRAAGAKGDGKTDDTAAINAALSAAAAAGQVVFFNAGYYKVTSTIKVPPGSKIVGEAYPVILSSGSYFSNMNSPKPVVQVGSTSGQIGTVEWSDMIVSTQGAQAGAILIEWNLASSGTPSGIWDVHARVGGFTGSNLQVAQCPKTPSTTTTSSNLNTACIAAYLTFHVTTGASNLYVENSWLWVADHDMDDSSLTQITVYAGRGLLIESTVGGIWLVGTAVEHHTLYEYQLVSTKDVFMGQIQTETAYYQPDPDATIPFPAVKSLSDPTIVKGQDGWGVRLVGSSNVFIYGAGLYSFFNNYNTSCSVQGLSSKCQSSIFSIESSSVSVYNLNTVGSNSMATVNGASVASWADNQNGFVSTLALLRV